MGRWSAFVCRAPTFVHEQTRVGAARGYASTVGPPFQHRTISAFLSPPIQRWANSNGNQLGFLRPLPPLRFGSLNRAQPYLSTSHPVGRGSSILVSMWQCSARCKLRATVTFRVQHFDSSTPNKRPRMVVSSSQTTSVVWKMRPLSSLTGLSVFRHSRPHLRILAPDSLMLKAGHQGAFRQPTASRAILCTQHWINGAQFTLHQQPILTQLQS
mmetsp:Transcript_11218/g.28701  ORF Transcript_11218/g.28701 Transcript_11218/m.28701 type:complete len:213 (+) Transcript_11218:977-1615(+)